MRACGGTKKKNHKGDASVNLLEKHCSTLNLVPTVGKTSKF